LQLSLDAPLWPWQHHELARPLRALREEGVLVIGSGNVTHDLRDAFGRMQRGDATTPDWAARFDATVVATLRARDTKGLLSLWPDTEDGRRSHPTPDHWLPLIYAHAASDDDDGVDSPIEGFDLGSLSMRAFRFG
jgi:4,5-DOPA dioxygenase extradiol